MVPGREWAGSEERSNPAPCGQGMEDSVPELNPVPEKTEVLPRGEERTHVDVA